MSLLLPNFSLAFHLSYILFTLIYREITCTYHLWLLIIWTALSGVFSILSYPAASCYRPIVLIFGLVFIIHVPAAAMSFTFLLLYLRPDVGFDLNLVVAHKT